MDGMIGFKELEFVGYVEQVTDNAGKLRDAKLKAPYVLCNSETLNEFIDAMKGVQDTINAYEEFVVNDMERIQKLVMNLKTQDMSAVIK